ncbi:hypothetical protein BDK51DRAFT_31980 [Blyttiomyces helicus]|uniref:Uncharacterized protein n=1 Tax=Blyttiomyces helicus TaxID=388810 RepID=A0A4P9WQP8_9FUNG|nr:hypothetical protein BDK51DRAFT_31980 [Blyttiomyces helicus]|eukprot:RKO93206.1 hypothetical protein BDK51DRAFT_31980 [Blyttiomyces helicus]
MALLEPCRFAAALIKRQLNLAEGTQVFLFLDESGVEILADAPEEIESSAILVAVGELIQKMHLDPPLANHFFNSDANFEELCNCLRLTATQNDVQVEILVPAKAFYFSGRLNQELMLGKCVKIIRSLLKATYEYMEFPGEYIPNDESRFVRSRRIWPPDPTAQDDASRRYTPPIRVRRVSFKDPIVDEQGTSDLRPLEIMTEELAVPVDCVPNDESRVVRPTPDQGPTRKSITVSFDDPTVPERGADIIGSLMYEVLRIGEEYPSVELQFLKLPVRVFATGPQDKVVVIQGEIEYRFRRFSRHVDKKYPVIAATPPISCLPLTVPKDSKPGEPFSPRSLSPSVSVLPRDIKRSDKVTPRYPHDSCLRLRFDKEILDDPVIEDHLIGVMHRIAAEMEVDLAYDFVSKTMFVTALSKRRAEQVIAQIAKYTLCYYRQANLSAFKLTRAKPPEVVPQEQHGVEGRCIPVTHPGPESEIGNSRSAIASAGSGVHSSIQTTGQCSRSSARRENAAQIPPPKPIAIAPYRSAVPPAAATTTTRAGDAECGNLTLPPRPTTSQAGAARNGRFTPPPRPAPRPTASQAGAAENVRFTLPPRPTAITRTQQIAKPLNGTWKPEESVVRPPAAILAAAAESIIATAADNESRMWTGEEATVSPARIPVPINPAPRSHSQALESTPRMAAAAKKQAVPFGSEDATCHGAYSTGPSSLSGAPAVYPSMEVLAITARRAVPAPPGPRLSPRGSPRRMGLDAVLVLVFLVGRFPTLVDMRIAPIGADIGVLGPGGWKQLSSVRQNASADPLGRVKKGNFKTDNAQGGWVENKWEMVTGPAF